MMLWATTQFHRGAIIDQEDSRQELNDTIPLREAP